MIRVTVVGGNPSLLIGLSVAAADLDVATVDDLHDVHGETDVIVVDLRDGERVPAELSVEQPLIVLTSGEHADDGDGRVHLRRPCSLDDLTRHIRAAVPHLSTPGPVDGRGADDEPSTEPVPDLDLSVPVGLHDLPPPRELPQDDVPESVPGDSLEDVPETAGSPTRELDQRPIGPAVRRRPPRAEPAPSESDPSRGAIRRGWWERRGKPDTSPATDLSARLGRTLFGAAELEGLLDELPMLLDPVAVADAVVQEIAEQLVADTCGLWRPHDDGWRAIAHRGFTTHEQRMIVPHDQPLFHEVHHTGGGVLIHPIDVVPTAVAGIGGAHTHGVMAAALAAGSGRYGIVVVGRDRQLTDPDLDRLLELVGEALPAVALASLLQRLRERATSRAVHPPDAEVAEDVIDLVEDRV